MHQTQKTALNTDHFQGIFMTRILYAWLFMLMAANTAVAEDPIRLNLSFDDQTRLTLAQIGERVTVNVWLYGEPTDEGQDFTDEMGQVYLGTETYDIWPVDQTLLIGGSLGGAPMDIVVQPMVNVNVYTSRIKDENNLINCGIVDGPFAELAINTQAITCSMLGG
jgi:hypothetical protein